MQQPTRAYAVTKLQIILKKQVIILKKIPKFRVEIAICKAFSFVF